MNIVSNSFKINFMKANSAKFQFIIESKNRCPAINVPIDSNVVNESAEVELLELGIDKKIVSKNILQNHAKHHHTNSMHSGK